MTDNVLQGPAHWVENARRAASDKFLPDEPLEGRGSGGPHTPDMDVTEYRLDQHEKRMDAQEAKLDAIQGSLNDIKVTLAGLSTKDTVRGWGIGIIVAVIASVLTVGGILVASSANQLSAFQAGLSAVQTKIAATPPPVNK